MIIDYSKFEGHTPGPWFFTGLKIHAKDAEMPGIPWVIAHVSDDAFYEGLNPAAPNSALLAAAPELLAENERLRDALAEILQVVPRIDAIPQDEYDPHGDYVELLKINRIAKTALKEQ